MDKYTSIPERRRRMDRLYTGCSNADQMTMPTQPVNPSEHDFLLFHDVIFKSESGTQYRIPDTGYISQGGEAVIYKAFRMTIGEDAAAGKAFAAKIYRAPLGSSELTNQHDKKCIVLKECNNVAEYHLMPLLDYGQAEIQTSQENESRHSIEIIPRFKSHHFIEIMPLLDQDQKTLEGELVSPEILHECYLPQIAQAIKSLHEKGIVHRDIKPGNIFHFGKDAVGKPLIVLGDYGTVGFLGMADRAAIVRTMRHGLGTIGYRSMETLSGISSYASDMYSLGCTIASLLHGAYFYPEDQQKADDYRITASLSECIQNDKWPFDIESSEIETKLRGLFHGLVQFADRDRFDIDTVIDFCKTGTGWKVPAINRAIGQRSFCIRVLNQMFYSRKELALGLSKKEAWDNATKLVRSGVLMSCLKDTSDADAAQFVYDTDKEVLDDNIALCRIIHWLHPNREIAALGYRFESLRDVCNQAVHEQLDVASIIECLLQGKYFSWKYDDLFNRGKDEYLQNEAAYLRKIEEMFGNERTRKIAYYALLLEYADADILRSHHLGSNAPDPDAKSYDWEAYVRVHFPENSSFCNSAIQLLGSDQQLAWLYNMGLNVEELIQNESTDQRINVYEVLHMFEDRCSLAVRKSFADYGPFSFVTWVQRNIDLYHFPEEHVGIKKSLMKYSKTLATEPLSVQLKHFNDLIAIYDQFVKEFDNNLLMAFAGLKKIGREKMITASFSHAFFTSEFWGYAVPGGFMSFMGA